MLDARNYALYFSRATIPWARDAFGAATRERCRRTCRFTATTGSTPIASRSCARYPTLPPAPIERFEALEQLRALWHGYRIVVEITGGTPAPGVDTPADLERVRALVRRQAAIDRDRRQRVRIATLATFDALTSNEARQACD